jgi:hypothetical protein
MFKQRPNKRRLFKLIDEEELNDQDLADALSSQGVEGKIKEKEPAKEVAKPEVPGE